MRTSPIIPETELRSCLREQYDIFPVTITYLPLGLDYYAGVYRVESEQGIPYLLKLKARPLYEPSCLVPYYLKQQGITPVVAPIPSNQGTLWTRVGTWTLVVFPFITGDTSITGMTAGQWHELGDTFRRIHNVPLPASEVTSLRRETFDPTRYVQWVDAFERQHVHVDEASDEIEVGLHATWLTHQATIRAIVTAMERLAATLQKRIQPYVICHADLHPANVLRDTAGHVHVLDWDDVMLAPRERDFIFVREPYFEAFFQGYGQFNIDWIALSYYLWERVITDLIECARTVCFGDELGEEARRDEAQAFHTTLTRQDWNLAMAREVWEKVR